MKRTLYRLYSHCDNLHNAQLHTMLDKPTQTKKHNHWKLQSNCWTSWYRWAPKRVLLTGGLKHLDRRVKASRQNFSKFTELKLVYRDLFLRQPTEKPLLQSYTLRYNKYGVPGVCEEIIKMVIEWSLNVFTGSAPDSQICKVRTGKNKWTPDISADIIGHFLLL